MCGVCVFTDVYSHGMHIPLSLHSGWFGPLAFRSVLLCVCRRRDFVYRDVLSLLSTTSRIPARAHGLRGSYQEIGGKSARPLMMTFT